MICSKTIFCLAFVSILALGQSQGAITLTLTGVYDTQNTTQFLTTDGSNYSETSSSTTVFGLSQPYTTPITFTFTFNDGVTPTKTVLANTTDLGGGVTTTKTLYGYMTSDLSSVSANVNGNIWNLGNSAFLSLRLGSSASFEADMWFDSIITSSTPTQAIFDLDATHGYIGSSNYTINANKLSFDGFGFIGDYIQSNPTIGPNFDSSIEASSTSALTITSTVPEPSRALFLLAGFSFMCLHRSRNTRRD